MCHISNFILERDYDFKNTPPQKLIVIITYRSGQGPTPSVRRCFVSVMPWTKNWVQLELPRLSYIDKVPLPFEALHSKYLQNKKLMQPLLKSTMKIIRIFQS